MRTNRISILHSFDAIRIHIYASTQRLQASHFPGVVGAIVQAGQLQFFGMCCYHIFIGLKIRYKYKYYFEYSKIFAKIIIYIGVIVPVVLELIRIKTL